ncbi:MAG: HlyD family efflux transporter periplasmic adaptor subunit [Timaviella obliquedivisa GSE-PSE-MK23-08B]|nr:HlyD family efflux transporter periplasmic adaptor subunit [Timaviella obliquedivisa GSE-PSE-MK23-08B]
MLNNSESGDLPLLQTQDFLPPLAAWVKFGGLFILGTIGVAVAIASVAQYRVTVKAPAIIRPTGELSLVQAATAGTVVQVQVRENQTVQQGEVIARIDNSQLQTKKAQLQNSIGQARLQLLQIQAQVRAIDSQMTAETDRREHAIASSQAEHSQRLREYQDQQIISSAEVTQAKASLQATSAASTAVQVKLQRYRPLAAVGALDRDRLEEAELAAQQQAQEVVAAESKLRQAEAMLNPTSAEVIAATEKVAQEHAMGEATLAALTKEQQALTQQKIQIENQLELDRQELNQVHHDLSKATITATTNGTIAKLTLRNAGQTMQPGEEIAQIVPSNARLVIKALVAAQDISKIIIGQTAQLRISACPYPDYGTLSGVVKSVSPDAIAPPKASEGAVSSPYYEVTLEPEYLMLSQGDRRCQIQVGMEGKIDIVSREDTVLRSILRKVRLISDL